MSLFFPSLFSSDLFMLTERNGNVYYITDQTLVVKTSWNHYTVSNFVEGTPVIMDEAIRRGF
jgi:hypothetical protein